MKLLHFMPFTHSLLFSRRRLVKFMCYQALILALTDQFHDDAVHAITWIWQKVQCHTVLFRLHQLG